jgi:hypothetical protein
MATNRTWLNINDWSDKDIICSGGDIRIKTGAYVYDQTGGNAPAPGATPVTTPSNPADGTIVKEIFDDNERYWSYNASTATWSVIITVSSKLTVTDGSNPFDAGFDDTLTVSSTDNSILVDTSVSGTVNAELNVVYVDIQHTGYETVVTPKASDDYFVVPAGLNGWTLTEVVYGQAGGVGDQTVRVVYNATTIGAATPLSGDSSATDSTISQVLSTGDTLRITSTVDEGSPEGLAATLKIVQS